MLNRCRWTYETHGQICLASSTHCWSCYESVAASNDQRQNCHQKNTDLHCAGLCRVELEKCLS